MHVHTAVIPAAGLGTRFLPATKAVPRRSCRSSTRRAAACHRRGGRCGIDRIVIVQNRNSGHRGVLRTFDEVIAMLRSTGRQAMAERSSRSARRAVSFAIRIHRRFGACFGCTAPSSATSPSPGYFLRVAGDSSLPPRCQAVRVSGASAWASTCSSLSVSSYGVIEPSTDIDASGVVGSARWGRSRGSRYAPSDLSSSVSTCDADVLRRK